MKLFKRLILILGGGALASFFICCLIMFLGITGTRDFVNGTAVGFQESALKHAAKSAILGNTAYLEEKIDAAFSALNLILVGSDTDARIKEYFQIHNPPAVDYVIVERRSTIYYRENQKRKSKQKLFQSSSHEEFLHQIKTSIGKKKYTILSARMVPGIIWIAYRNPSNGDLAIIRVDGATLLSGFPSSSPRMAASLVLDEHFAATYNQAGTPVCVMENMEKVCGKSDHNHQHRMISNTVIRDRDNVLWSIASAHLYTRAENAPGLHVIHARRSSEEFASQVEEIRKSFSGILLLLGGTFLLAILIFIPVLLITARKLAAQIRNTVSFVRNVFQSDERPRNLELKFSSEMEELAGGLNLLRDKLNNALNRLSRSHERELRAKKEAEESNVLQSGLLTGVLAEVRDPLSRIDGFCRVIQQKYSGDPELAEILEQIRLENRTMISVFRALSDLTGLDSEFCVLGSYQIEPSEIIRNAIGDLTARATQSNIALEVRNAAAFAEPLTTSPSILTHMVYTAAATLIRFMPRNTTLHISSEWKNNTLVFRFADQVTDHLSIADVFTGYTQTGKISTPHCAVAVLNLLILKTEAEYLSADIRIEKNETANSMIEIILPVQAFNPAVTGVFTRPKLMADTTKISTAARFHVAGITSASLSGRNPFRSEGSIGAVLLANMKAPDTTLYRMMLEAEGFAVAAAEHEEERFAYIRNNRFDLVFLDMTLEQKDNFAAITEIRKAVPASTVLIVITDSRKVEYVEQLISSGADYCFRKPVVATDLLSEINKLRAGGKEVL